MKIVLITVVILSLLGQKGAAQNYEVIDLGTLGGNASRAYGINDHGQVVGEATIENGQIRAFLYDEGSMKNLGTLGGFHSEARGINSYGQVVGCSTRSTNQLQYPVAHAFLYSNGVMEDISGGKYTSAYGINDKGEVIGTVTFVIGTYDYRAFLYSNGSLKVLGTLGGYFSTGASINNQGQVVGSAAIASGGSPLAHAFISLGSSMQDLGTLEGFSGSYASGINDGGDIIGVSYNPSVGLKHSFIYSNGVMQNLGTLGGFITEARGINNHGHVVGNSTTGPGPGKYLDRAFLYSSGEMRDLNDLIPPDSGWFLRQATAINNRGQIVGYGESPSGQWRAFLLNPVSPSPLRLSLTRDAEEGVLIELTGPPGSYRVESSANLTDWQTVAVLLNTNGKVPFRDKSTNSVARFYRASTY